MKRLFIAAFLLTAGLAGAVDDIFEGAPPVPPGYANEKEVRTAVLTGKVPMVKEPETIPDDVEAHKDIVYANPENGPVKLDLFLPKDRATPPPLLIFIHGGGWSKGNKDDYLYYNVEFAKDGYATASLQYRLSPENHFPAALIDVKCAIAWLRDHASEYGYDPARIALVGGSAGGHLSLLAGYCQDPKFACPGSDTDTRVQAIVNLYGVTDCTTPVAIKAHQVLDFMGATYDEAKESYEAASPNFHIDANDPPTLTFHGSIDELVPLDQPESLHKKLDAAGVINYYDLIEGWPHTMDIAQPVNDHCRYVMKKFFEKHLKP